MNSLIAAMMPHLMIAPILLPLLTAALMLLIGEDKLHIKLFANLLSTLVGLFISVNLLLWVDRTPGNMAVYLAGNWSAPWGIVLVLDRLSAMMLVLTSCVAMASALFAAARWHRAGIHFHPLFQLQLMGLCGAFLTGDLFSLFVFFEIMLAASYGLLLHGSGRARVQAGLHFIAINLAASSLFLIGASMLYGITGTLNMADLAQRIPQVLDTNRGLLHAAAGILATAFLIKAAVWPLNFWLVPAYSSATAPVGALFSIMTKVGIYVILRLWLLLFGALAGPSVGFGGLWLIAGGLLTMLFGAVGMLGSQRLAYLAGFSAILSSGSVLAAIGFGQTSLTAGLLYYLPSSTLAICALFLIADLMERWRNDGATLASYIKDATPFLSPDLRPVKGLNLDDDQEAVTGRVIPAAVALLGLAFMACTLVITGMPPLSGFVGKFAMLSALLNPLGLGISSELMPGIKTWALVGLLIGTGIVALIALTRIGILHFWATYDRASIQVRIMEGLPIAGLLMLCAIMTVQAGPVMRFMQDTAVSLHNPSEYVQFVLTTKPVPSMPVKNLAADKTP
jgi:multicomponent K+:H+ antiporter subunit D